MFKRKSDLTLEEMTVLTTGCTVFFSILLIASFLTAMFLVYIYLGEIITCPAKLGLLVGLFFLQILASVIVWIQLRLLQ